MPDRLFDKIRNAPDLLIVVGATLLFAVLALLYGFWAMLADTRSAPPTYWGDAPADSVEIYGLLKFEYAAAVWPCLRDAKGVDYAIAFGSRSADQDPWEVVDYDLDLTGQPCAANRLKVFERRAGEIVSCLEWVDPDLDDLCPSHTLSYALNAEGELWRMTTRRTCWPIMWMLAIPGAVLGFMLSLFYVIGKTMYMFMPGMRE